MSIAIEKKFKVEIVYNGIEKPFEVEPEEQVTALLQKAIAAFGITQNPHLLSLFRLDGSVVPENESVERAGLKPGEVLLLRPNAVKGGTDLLRLTELLVPESFETLRGCGLGECECVVYWTGPSTEAIADGVEHPNHRRSCCGYQIDYQWLTDFFKHLAISKRSAKAQVHTHPGAAFHSATDDEWPIVSQAGFLSIVVPEFAKGAASLDNAWIGRMKPNGEWQRLASASEAIAFV